MSEVSYLEDEHHGLLPFDQDEISQAYMHYLKQGLPDSGAIKKKVLIVGCGIAGMVSASLLRKAGHEVTVIEADSRVGGRIRTFRNSKRKKYFEDDLLTGEAGAMRIPDMHKLAQYLIDYTGVEKQIFLNKTVSKEDAISDKIQNPDRDEYGEIVLPESTGKNLLHINYHHVLRKDYESCGDVNKLLEYNLGEDENKKAIVLLDAAIDQLRRQVEESPKTAWPDIIKKYSEYSMRRFIIEQNPELSENAIEMIGVMENLESRMSYSFIQSFIELAIIKPDTPFWLIKGGTDKFSEAYFEKEGLSEVTFTNQTLVDIYKESGKVRIKTKVSDENSEQIGRDDAVSAMLGDREWDEAIVTIPFPCFRMVHVWPALSQTKRKAIRELHYDAATKVLLEFRERFWETENGIYGGGSVTDLPNRFMYYPSERMGSVKGGVMLASYSWADDARKWDSMSEYERFCYALENVAITHAIHAPDASYEERQEAQQKIRDLCVFDPEKYANDQDNIVGAATISWMNNPYAFGEAAIFYPGQLDLLHKSIVDSEWELEDGSRKILHFAGEHASLKHAWIEGSIESAVRSALLANENVLPTLTRP